MNADLANAVSERDDCDGIITGSRVAITQRDKTLFAWINHSGGSATLESAPKDFGLEVGRPIDTYQLESIVARYIKSIGGKKFDGGKLRYDLIPADTFKQLVEVITFGANKYAPNNWQKVESDRYIAALYRHVEAWRMGEERDQESGLHHLAHAMCNVLFLLWKDDNE